MTGGAELACCLDLGSAPMAAAGMPAAAFGCCCPDGGR